MTWITWTQAVQSVMLGTLTFLLLKNWSTISYHIRSLVLRRNPHNKILREAVTALYLGGGTRTYTGALWEIINSIDPQLAELMSTDERAAYRLVHPEAED